MCVFVCGEISNLKFATIKRLIMGAFIWCAEFLYMSVCVWKYLLLGVNQIYYTKNNQ